MFRQLLAHTIIEADVSQYGALVLNEAARPILKGQSRLEFRRQRAAARGAGSRRARGAGDAVIELDAADQQMFERLRAWRQETAKTQQVPAYVILHDRTLRELAQRRPRERTELEDISGLGAAKIERYGDALLSALQEG